MDTPVNPKALAHVVAVLAEIQAKLDTLLDFEKARIRGHGVSDEDAQKLIEKRMAPHLEHHKSLAAEHLKDRDSGEQGEP
jgi:hypothetical protein